MATRNKQMIPIKFPFFHVVLSHFIVMFCTICFFEDEQFVRTGKLYSPITLILIVGELIRWSICKYAFGLDVSNKDYSISGAKQASVKNVSIVTHIKKLCKLCGLLAIFVAIFGGTCILLGASYHQNYEETLALAVLLTSLAVLPIGLFLGPSKTVQYLFYDSFELHTTFDIYQFELLQYNAFGTLVGAYAASMVTPLDWDRPWQVYPIPNMVGAVLGFSFANIHSFLSSIVQISDRMIDLTMMAGEKKAV